MNVQARPIPRHYVDTRPFDPGATEPVGAEKEEFYRASAWKLMWLKFRRHKVAVASAYVLLAFYLMVPFVELIAPYNQVKRNGDFLYAPPQPVHLFHDGGFVGPFVYPYKFTFNLETFRRDYTVDRSTPQRIRFFCRGDAYDLWGLIPMRRAPVLPAARGDAVPRRHGPARARPVLPHPLRGAHLAHHRDRRHRRVLRAGPVLRRARRLHGRLGRSRHPAGDRDPALACPSCRSGSRCRPRCRRTGARSSIFFGITIILGLLDWPGLARAVRSKLLSLREEDFVKAAELMGASKRRIITRHLIPNFMSHLIASATLSIPGMILGETALSFLGLGLRPPVTSWGVLLNEAQNLAAVQLHPWLLFPILPVVIVVLAFNFMGDGLRDAADPYH